ncbi:MAG: dihydroneopterin aldolase [Chloroflexota bacterium]
MDKIIIKDLRAHGILGVYPRERQAPQDILINLTVYADTSRAAQSDDIADCVDYDALAKKVKAHAESAARLTVEALANDIAKLCLQERGVKNVCVRVEKPDAVAEAASAGVEIERGRE